MEENSGKTTYRQAFATFIKGFAAMIKKIYLPLISLALALLLCFLLSAAVDDEMIFPSPVAVWAELLALAKTSVFYGEILSNLGRTLLSFSSAFVLASVAAAFASRYVVVEKLFYPLVAATRSVPTMSVILWCLIIFRSDKSPMAVSFIVIFPMLYSAVKGAIKQRDKSLDEMARVFNVGGAKAFFVITLPDVAKRLYPQFLSTLSFNVKLTVAGEALAYTRSSLGREMKIANANLETARLFAITVAVILLSVALEFAVRAAVEGAKRCKNGYDRKKIIEKLR
ncbi:MAG: ABC transporter permease subunit [Clostridia bacterium]|nr:ABC transporter permease subunit [Clostridia bacterium]